MKWRRATKTKQNERQCVRGRGAPSSFFLTEVEVTAHRIGSLLFQKLVPELCQRSKSLAELLHHSMWVVNPLLADLLSPRGKEMKATPCRLPKEGRRAYVERLADDARHVGAGARQGGLPPPDHPDTSAYLLIPLMATLMENFNNLQK